MRVVGHATAQRLLKAWLFHLGTAVKAAELTETAEEAKEAASNKRKQAVSTGSYMLLHALEVMYYIRRTVRKAGALAAWRVNAESKMILQQMLVQSQLLKNQAVQAGVFQHGLHVTSVKMLHQVSLRMVKARKELAVMWWRIRMASQTAASVQLEVQQHSKHTTIIIAMRMLQLAMLRMLKQGASRTLKIWYVARQQSVQSESINEQVLRVCRFYQSAHRSVSAAHKLVAARSSMWLVHLVGRFSSFRANWELSKMAVVSHELQTSAALVAKEQYEEVREAARSQVVYRRNFRITAALCVRVAVHQTKLNYFRAFKINTQLAQRFCSTIQRERSQTHFAIIEKDLNDESERANTLAKENKLNSALVKGLKRDLEAKSSQALRADEQCDFLLLKMAGMGNQAQVQHTTARTHLVNHLVRLSWQAAARRVLRVWTTAAVAVVPIENAQKAKLAAGVHVIRILSRWMWHHSGHRAIVSWRGNTVRAAEIQYIAWSVEKANVANGRNQSAKPKIRRKSMAIQETTAQTDTHEACDKKQCELEQQCTKLQSDLTKATHLQCIYERGLRICTVLAFQICLQKTKLTYFSLFKRNADFAIERCETNSGADVARLETELSKSKAAYVNLEKEFDEEIERSEVMERENREKAALLTRLQGDLVTTRAKLLDAYGDFDKSSSTEVQQQTTEAKQAIQNLCTNEACITTIAAQRLEVERLNAEALAIEQIVEKTHVVFAQIISARTLAATFYRIFRTRCASDISIWYKNLMEFKMDELIIESVSTIPKKRRKSTPRVKVATIAKKGRSRFDPSSKKKASFNHLRTKSVPAISVPSLNFAALPVKPVEITDENFDSQLGQLADAFDSSDEAEDTPSNKEEPMDKKESTLMRMKKLQEKFGK